MKSWKPVKGYEGLYEVSTDGEIKSLGNFPNLRNKKVGNLKPGNCRGYLIVVLTDTTGVRSSKFVHRIVAEVFLENPFNHRVVNHIDEDKTNNQLSNLEWCSDQYNKEYSLKKEYSFIHIDGRTVQVKNVTRFCRENNLAQGNLSKVIAGLRSHHKGWSLLV